MTIAGSPIVIVRGKDGALRAFFNTCRHRGAQICQQERGNITGLVCPYHQWTYDLYGRLMRPRSMPADFKAEDHGLRPIAVEVVAGVVFVCLNEHPPDFGPLRAALAPMLEPHELHRARIAHTAVLIEQANWKLVMENARECHHCRARHPQLMRAFRDFTTGDVFAQPEPWLTEFWERVEGRGLPSRPVSGPQFEAGRYPLLDGVASLTSDGRHAVRKMLGRVGDGNVGTFRWALQPNSFSHAFGDYAFLFHAFPTGPRQTTVTAKWVVHQDAVEGVDYELAALLEIWNVTNLEDQWLAENNQRGVNCAGYTPGPYVPVAESRVVEFVDWYCKVARDFLIAE
jgi:Rieske 2Fe-2S family protein